MSADPTPSRALVLGGGGVTGIAWEIGVLAGLRAANVTFSDADAVIGTSAGSFVGAALASGYDLQHMFDAQSTPNDTEIAAVTSAQVTAAWYDAFTIGGSDAPKIGAALGRIGKNHPTPIPLADRRAVIESRLTTTDWPPTLRITAIDADTGSLHVFDAGSGVTLVEAASASGAVPGVWPVERFAGKCWIDGGMVSTANTRLAEGFDRVVVLAPMPEGHGAIPGAEQDVSDMGSRCRIALISPDEASAAAIGSNIYDPTRRGPAAAAGHVQGLASATSIASLW